MGGGNLLHCTTVFLNTTLTCQPFTLAPLPGVRQKRQPNDDSQPPCSTRGRDGRDGPAGRDGRDGLPGPVGPPGGVGPRGPAGLRGVTGEPGGGVTYVRWGRTTCPSGAVIVYEGVGAGSRYSERGGTSDTLCLPKDPQYRSHDTSNTWTAELYGVEYEFNDNTYPRSLHEADMPCALCYLPTKSAVFMQPAKYTCPSGWHYEYSGYLFSDAEHGTRGGRKDTICVDRQAEAVPGSAPNTDPAPATMMRATCNGIHCPPYNTRWPLTCAVCSK